MIVMFKSTPLPPTRFVFLIIYSYLTHRPSVDMVPPVNENDPHENDSSSNSKCSIALNNNKIIDEAKRKRRFESMMAESEDEDKIVENKDSNQNSICTRE